MSAIPHAGATMTELEPLAPDEAVTMYLDHRQADLSKKTQQNQRYRLTRFVEWCEEVDLDNLNRLTGRDLHRYRTQRGEDIKTVTLVNELRTLQKFLEFCASIDAVETGMRERVLIPDLDRGDETKDIQLDNERAEEILAHLDRFHYASREHVVLALLWHTGIRLGALRAIDVGDYDPAGRVIEILHRPGQGTPLKNRKGGERVINISVPYCEMLDEYIRHHRDAVTDEHGREPLITSREGRLTAVPIRQLVYKITQPCFIGPCPHEKDPETCEWVDRYHRRECPSSRSPHAIRRGSITHRLRTGTLQEVVEERVNASKDVIDRHYDERTEREKAETRRRLLDDMFEHEGDQ